MEKIPPRDGAAEALFKSILPGDEQITVRPMFGNLAAFVRGNMFAGVFGTTVFLRLPEEERERLIAAGSAEGFAPMPGRPMREYVTLAGAIRDDPEQGKILMNRSLAWVASMPAKVPKQKPARRTPKK